MTALFLGNVEVPTIEDISIPVNYVIADIREPSKRQSNHTLDIRLPATKEVEEFFEFAGNPSIAFQTYDPNVKDAAVVKRNGIPILKGYVQLLKVTDNWFTGVKYYHIKIQGLQAELYYAIGDALLTDLDFSTYDHVLNKANVFNTWYGVNQVAGTPTVVTNGTGYRYPIADYGYDGSGARGTNPYQDFYVHHLRPVLFVHEYLSKIFTAAGKTFTSSFLSGSFFKKLAIPSCKAIEVSETQRLARTFYVGETGTQNHVSNMAYVPAQNAWTVGGGLTPVPVNDLLYFPNETTPFHDASAQIDAVTGVITIGAAGNYTITSVVDFTLVIDNTGSSNGPIDNYAVTYDFVAKVQKFIAGSWTDVQNSDVLSGAALSHSPGDPAVGSITVTHVPGSVAPGDQFRITIESSVAVKLYNSSSAFIVDGTTTYNVECSTGTICRLDLVTNHIQEGDDLEVNQCLPEKIKQKDFLSSIIKAFNLIVDVDKDDPNNYIIEPDPTFYGASTVDWTNKLDIGKDIEIIPMGDLDAKKYIYTYKNDSDYYNKRYQDQYGEAYGSHEVIIPNEYLQAEHKAELIFSPTPLVGNTKTSMLYPVVYKNETGTPEVQKFNIRLWIWGGIIPFAGQFTLKSVSGDSSFPNSTTTPVILGYPYAGHLDDPFNPTMDLCFDNPQEVYWDQVTPYTSANLYTTYHQPMIDEISHKDSKVIKAWFNLDEMDIKEFDFRNYVIVRNAKCIVNAINGFNANEKQSTEVELLKLTS